MDGPNGSIWSGNNASHSVIRSNLPHHQGLDHTVFRLTHFVAVDHLWGPRSNQVELAVIKSKFLKGDCHLKSRFSACLNLFCYRRAVRSFCDVFNPGDKYIQNPYGLLYFAKYFCSGKVLSIRSKKMKNHNKWIRKLEFELVGSIIQLLSYH